jgi:predicted RNA binding protein YcfA (HicA-like mRNA interferase family)
VKTCTGREVCSLLEQNGWLLKRIKGSHHIYAKVGERALIVVPVHGNRPLKTGLLKAILRVGRLQQEEPR